LKRSGRSKEQTELKRSPAWGPRPKAASILRPPIRILTAEEMSLPARHPWPSTIQLAKTFADKALALALLVLLAPLFLVVAILVRLTSPGPVIYRQIRIGIDRRFATSRRGAVARERRAHMLPGRPFVIYKFRTMVDGAENGLGPTWASPGDPRVTPVGRVLRLLRIDETPQFWNVLKGDMSLVGPRPERPSFVNDLIASVPGYAHRLRVKPGITGLAQVEHQYDSCLDDVRTKVHYDLHYIREHGLWLDVKILLKTIIVVLTGRGAR
jgi:lipopolysaccharide/colanic/teichoic acid biosynthesis glycosyltransferase